MKVKGDHRSKFSNLSNWKEGAWKYQNLIPVRCLTNWAVKPCIGSDAWLLPSNCLKSSLPNGFCLPIAYNGKFTTMITLHFHLQPQYRYEFHIYFTSFHCTGRYELNQLTSLSMCGFTAELVEHRTGITEVTGSNPIEALIFSGFFLPVA